MLYHTRGASFSHASVGNETHSLVDEGDTFKIALFYGLFPLLLMFLLAYIIVCLGRGLKLAK